MKNSLSGALAELPNRLFFNEILKKSINHAKRHHKILGVMLIESKNTELINTLQSALRTDDILAVLDTDRGLYGILLSDIGQPKFLGIIIEKIKTMCRGISFRAGICSYPNDGDTLEQLLQHAEEALTQAKDYQFYSASLDKEARDYYELSMALKNAITDNQLQLYYQPKLHLKQGNISGIEALIRWEHPTLGLMNTGHMIKLAEETGLIASIGEWAIKEACLRNKYWQKEGYEHLTIGVNVSPKQFYDKNFIRKLEAIFEETQLNPEFLELEINESTVMGRVDDALTILENIKALGVKVTIDHFGVGYTSISHLKLFPINHLKIDHSFIKGLPNTPNDMAIVNAFIALAHHLGFEVIAEGVETPEQVQYLSLQGCDIVQGYFLSDPLSAEQMELQLKKITDEVMF